MQSDNFYLAGRYARKEELKGYADELKEQGYNVTATWLYDNEDNISQSDLTPEGRAIYAVRCIQDITKSDNFILFTEDLLETPFENFTKEEFFEYSRGGRHVELGFAMAWGMDRIIFIGPAKENIFQYVDNMEHFLTFEDFVDSILLDVDEEACYKDEEEILDFTFPAVEEA